eukprot:294164-Alexandrium_andersonii.AAC.1
MSLCISVAGCLQTPCYLRNLVPTGYCPRTVHRWSIAERSAARRAWAGHRSSACDLGDQQRTDIL